MKVIDERVRHRIYGVGKITEQSETLITVLFSENGDIKKFIYPTAFEQFLEMCDPASQDKIRGEIREINEQKEADRKKLAEEAEKAKEEELLNQQVLKQALKKKRNVSSSKKTSKKSSVSSNSAE